MDAQNAKIDALSQEILKLEQQLSHIRPGIMIGENTPGENTSSSPIPAAPAESASHATSGNTHTVARGETLTSIAKMYKVGVDELQKFNHIEDGRKLQAGQTIVIQLRLRPGLLLRRHQLIKRSDESKLVSAETRGWQHFWSAAF